MDCSRTSLGPWLLAAWLAAACDQGDPPPPRYVHSVWPADAGALDGGGRDGDGGSAARGDGGTPTRRDGGTPVVCPEEAKLVYVVDQDGRFSSFNPESLRFQDLGSLHCSDLATPFSMGIDRSPRAYVLYSDGQVYKVDVANGHCQSTAYVPGQEGMFQFGMGFVSNTAGSQDETLFIAGGTSVGSGFTQTLATLDPASWGVRRVGSVEGSPELTGTGAAQLWGFFPDAFTPRIEQIDVHTGDTLDAYDYPELQGVPAAWAFAFWGGDFWIFLMRQEDSSTVVYRAADLGAGGLTVAVPDTGRRIVGAGVSTCAPLLR